MKTKTVSPDEHNFFQIINTVVSKPKTLYFIGTLPTVRFLGVNVVAVVGTKKP